MFPISKEGYESMKKAGFDIISCERVKNTRLHLYEVCYQSLEKKAALSMTFLSNLSRLDLFKARSGDAYIPIVFSDVLEDEMLYSQLVEVKENYRNFLREDVILCLSQNKALIDLIKDELK